MAQISFLASRIDTVLMYWRLRVTWRYYIETSFRFRWLLFACWVIFHPVDLFQSSYTSFIKTIRVSNGLDFCRSMSGFALFANVITRRQKLPLTTWTWKEVKGTFEKIFLIQKTGNTCVLQKRKRNEPRMEVEISVRYRPVCACACLHLACAERRNG